METRLEQTLVPGKLVREPPEAVARVLITEVQAGEVVVALLETATERTLASTNAKVWLALTDKRVCLVASIPGGESYFFAAPPRDLQYKSRLGRDDITIGDQTLKCPLLLGAGEFKQLAALAAADVPERLGTAARQRLQEGKPQAAAALSAAGLDTARDPGLLSIRVQALLQLEQFHELGPALVALLEGDSEFATWEELEQPLRNNSRALWMLYEAAQDQDMAAAVRRRLADLRSKPPADPLIAELAIRMEADEGHFEQALSRATGWLQDGNIQPQTFLGICDVLRQAGLGSESLHRERARALGMLDKLDEALAAAREGLAIAKTAPSLRMLSELLIRSGKAAEAVLPLEELLGAGEKDHWTRSKLADGYEALGKHDEAITAREAALDSIAGADTETELVWSERRALARMHRAHAETLDSRDREIALACAEVLEHGLDWAARQCSPPELVLSGTTLAATVDVLAARPLSVGASTASLKFEEAVVDPKAPVPEPPPAPPLLEGGVAGVWPQSEPEPEGVQTTKRGARVRYSVSEAVPLALTETLSR